MSLPTRRMGDYVQRAMSAKESIRQGGEPVKKPLSLMRGGVGTRPPKAFWRARFSLIRGASLQWLQQQGSNGEQARPRVGILTSMSPESIPLSTRDSAWILPCRGAAADFSSGNQFAVMGEYVFRHVPEAPASSWVRPRTRRLWRRGSAGWRIHSSG